MPAYTAHTKSSNIGRTYQWFQLCRSGLVHLIMDQRITGPVSCRCLEPQWFVGDPTDLARDNIYVLLHSVHWSIDPTSIEHLMKLLKIPQLNGAPIAAMQLIAILNSILTIT